MDIGASIVALTSGAVIALLSTWLTSRYAEKKHQREQRAEFLQLIGRQQELVHRSGMETNQMTLTKKYANWLDEERPDSATLALVIGYLQQGAEQMELLAAEAERLRAETQKLKQQLAGEAA